MTCCFDDQFLIKNCEFMTPWLFSEENATLREIWEVQSRIVQEFFLICLSESARRGLIPSGCDNYKENVQFGTKKC